METIKVKTDVIINEEAIKTAFINNGILLKSSKLEQMIDLQVLNVTEREHLLELFDLKKSRGNFFLKSKTKVNLVDISFLKKAEVVEEVVVVDEVVVEEVVVEEVVVVEEEVDNIIIEDEVVEDIVDDIVEEADYRFLEKSLIKNIIKLKKTGKENITTDNNIKINSFIENNLVNFISDFDISNIFETLKIEKIDENEYVLIE